SRMASRKDRFIPTGFRNFAHTIHAAERKEYECPAGGRRDCARDVFAGRDGTVCEKLLAIESDRTRIRSAPGPYLRNQFTFRQISESRTGLRTNTGETTSDPGCSRGERGSPTSGSWQPDRY